MAFKRETNDKSYLNLLRQRRIKDLLAEDIPKDEASLLSNGRFSCTVCHHKPVFDTVDMMMLHRKGKKHQASVLHHEQEKEELKELIQKRRHEEFIKTGSTDIKIADVHVKNLISSVPYDSRVKKKPKPYDRRPKISLTTTVEGTSSTALPGNRISDMITMQKEGPLKHPRQLKKIYESPNSEFHIQPYQRKSGNSSMSQDVKRRSQMEHIEEINSTRTVRQCKSDREARGSSKTSIHPPPSQSSVTETEMSGSGLKTDSAEKKELAQKYWQMAGSGWKKDWDGKWIRDEECEFDSDEEPPDLP